MKRPKKATVTRETYTAYMYYLQCPHCKVELRGSCLSEEVLRILCWYCNNPIDFVHEVKEDETR